MLPKQFKLPFASNKNSLEKIFGDNPINCHSGLAKECRNYRLHNIAFVNKEVWGLL